mgnify:CR=1 FL=1
MVQSIFTTPMLPDLDERVKSLLSFRLANSKDFTALEISQVSSLEHRVLPRSKLVNTVALERFRTLCQLYRCELRALRQISSHRAVIGGVIVFAKRILWRVMQSQLREHFEQMQEFHLNLIEEHARLISVEVEALG